MKTVVISQPTYLPWSGYFRIMKEADVYVFLDNVQFEPRSWQCRNLVKSVKPVLLTVPVRHKGQSKIIDVEIDNSQPWRRKHWNAIKASYGKALYFDTYSPFLKSVYEREWTKLAALNIYVIQYLASQLSLSPVFLQASTLDLKGKRTGLLLEICKMLEADRYVSSVGAKEYMEKDGAKELFQKEGIMVEFLQFCSANFAQPLGTLNPELSVVDCLFNYGPESSKIIFSEKSAVFQTI